MEIKMKKLKIKHSRFCFDEWDSCISKMSTSIKEINNNDFCGYLGLTKICEVKKVQAWIWDNKEITVCNAGMEWLMIAPQKSNYVITMILDHNKVPVVWYVDMRDGIGTDQDGMYFYIDNINTNQVLEAH